MSKHVQPLSDESAVAKLWVDETEVIEDFLAPVTRAIIQRSDLAPGMRVLELACGAGGLGLAITTEVGGLREFVMSDISPEMMEIAARRAKAQGMSHMCVRELDLEGIAEDDESFDAVVCRSGLMYVDGGRASREMARVLVQGGRATCSVLGPEKDNPWMNLILEAAHAETGAYLTSYGVSPFSLSNPDTLGEVFATAGFSRVEIQEIPLRMPVANFESWWRLITRSNEPLAKLLSDLPAQTVRSIRNGAWKALEEYRERSDYALPGLHLLVTGVVPSGLPR
ncbi:class I SAM-dependent methyltransferase [Streptomyces sp. 1222.5]|uniref:class I SAM-dependent methyltransferase n=1 Tax=Streptomyces sp. 1222.5 TaxID=1881026 RepID=UPI003EBA1122